MASARSCLLSCDRWSASIYAICGVREDDDQHWTIYTVAMLAFSFAGFAILYLLQRVQGVLPFNPQHFGGVSEHLAFNTSISFVTNTNWQSYVPETTYELSRADGRV